MDTNCFLTLISALIAFVIIFMFVITAFAYNIHSELKEIRRIIKDTYSGKRKNLSYTD